MAVRSTEPFNSNRYPRTPVRPVEKTIGGISFVDDYAWLQEDSKEALDWQWAQDALAKKVARELPDFAGLKDRIAANLGPRLEMYARHRMAGGRFFHMSRNASDTGWLVRAADQICDGGRVVLDSTRLPGTEVNILAIAPSPDGKRLAAAVTEFGEQIGRWITVDVASREIFPQTAEGINLFNCAEPGWLPDGSGYLINDRDHAGAHRVRYIDLGDAAGPEARVFSSDEVSPSVPGLSVQLSPGGRWAATVSEPHQRCVLHKLNSRSGKWSRFVPEDFDGECHGEWADDDTYIAMVTENAPRGRIVAIPAETSQDRSTWKELVPQGQGVLRTLSIIAGRVVVFELVDVALNIRLFALDGSTAGVVPLPPHGMSHLALVPRRIERSEALVFPFASFLQTTTWYHYDFDTAALNVVGEPGKTLQGIEVSQRFARASDDQRIPYFVVRRENHSGTQAAPTLLNAYGGFNVAWLPFPLEHLVPFIEAGGIYLHANLRGGSEYGRGWFEQGCLANEQTTFDDLYAVAEDAIADGLTRPGLLALQGHSHGGLLAGVALTQRPDLWRVVCPTSPLLDCMEPVRPDRPETVAIQAYFLQEYGDPQDPKMAPCIHAYSPYHNVRPGTKYPAIFQVFGEKDPGCAPFHGRKFTARMQAATRSGMPVLLRVWRDTGHGALEQGKAAEQLAEWLAFVMHHLGMCSSEVAIRQQH